MSFRSNFYDVLSLNYKLSKVFGFCQLSRNVNGAFETKTTRVDVFIILFWSIFYGYNCFNVYLKPNDQSKYSSTIYYIGISIVDMTSILIQISVIWLNFVHRKKTVKIVRNIQDVSQKVRI